MSKRIMKKIVNEVKENKHILTLNGYVGGSGWFDDEFISVKDVRKSLDNVNKDIVIKINSPGGDVFAGVEIYNYLTSLESHVTVEVTGLAASAASLITMAGDTVVMRTGSTMMIHEASTFVYGNKKEIQKTLNALEAIDTSIVDIYVERTGLNAEDIHNLIAEETWFTADEAVKNGFADKKSKVKADEEHKEKKVDNLIKFVAVADEDEDDQEEKDSLEDRVETLESTILDLESRLEELEEDDSKEEDPEEEPVENVSSWLFL